MDTDDNEDLARGATVTVLREHLEAVMGLLDDLRDVGIILPAPVRRAWDGMSAELDREE